MAKFKKKVFSKLEDFYATEDLRDPDIMPRNNLLITDFNAKGHLKQPRAPCVVTSIDPDYLKDMRSYRKVRKFCVKTDILKLREVTRRKFMIYATQQRFLEKQRDAEFQEMVFQNIQQFNEFAATSLNKMESNAFNEVIKANKKLEKLKQIKVGDEYKQLMEEQQRILMQVQDIYRRFLFLLKLISYFDSIADEIDRGEQITLPKPDEITKLDMSDKNPAGRKEIELIKNYVEHYVRPYLEKRKHLNADIWIKGYEYIRLKISSYNQRFAQLALLNHIVSMIYEKYQKWHNRQMKRPIYLRDPVFMQKRVEALKERAKEVFEEYVEVQKDDKLKLKLDAIVPVVLERIENILMDKNQSAPKLKQVKDKTKAKEKKKEKKDDDSSEYGGKKETTIEKIEKLQAIVLKLLNKFDTFPPELIKTVEKRVRRKMLLEKERSRGALVSQNRLQNWIEHYKKHELKKPK